MAENPIRKQPRDSKKQDNTYNVYRTCTQGDSALVVQSLGRCMMDKDNKLTNEARRTIQSAAGEQVVRCITSGKSMHFHMKMDAEGQPQVTTACPRNKAEK